MARKWRQPSDAVALKARATFEILQYATDFRINLRQRLPGLDEFHESLVSLYNALGSGISKIRVRGIELREWGHEIRILRQPRKIENHSELSQRGVNRRRSLNPTSSGHHHLNRVPSELIDQIPLVRMPEQDEIRTAAWLDRAAIG